MSKIVGRSGSLVLVRGAEFGVIIDTKVELIVETGKADDLAISKVWKNTNEFLPASLNTLVASALTSLASGTVVASGKRLYTIPAGVQAEAEKALDWHREEHRGGTPVGLGTARLLAKGGQISLQKVRHIAKYFPRHEVDKKGKGWEPGEDNFPSNGRIAWALWGGDAGRRWASSIVEREDKKALTADIGGYDADIDAFKQAYELDEAVGPEFLARVRLNGSGIDRLYKIDLDGSVCVWDGDCWNDLGHVDGDVYGYDHALDDPYDMVEKSHFVIDADSAIIISAKMQQNPFGYVSIFDIDAEEAALAQDALEGSDFSFIDTLTAAAPTDSVTLKSTVQTDGNYTPEERSTIAKGRVRDANGKFAANGSRVSVAGGKQGNITKINPANQTATVKFDDGTTADVPANTTQKVSVNAPAPTTLSPNEPLTHLDTSGILAQPRTPQNVSMQLPGTLPAMSSTDLRQVMNDWPSWVASQRGQYQTPNQNVPAGPTAAKNPKTPYDRSTYNPSNDPAVKAMEKIAGKKLITDAYKHPLLKDWINKTSGKGITKVNNAIFYQPVTSSAGDRPQELTPTTSDIQPIYMAIVAPDDPKAVTALIALIPASSKSNEPMTYSRQDGKWVRDPKTLADLNSATPPPVVPLDADALDSVLKQADGLTAAAYTPDHVLTVLWGNAVTAAGGVDRNRGNAEQLREYWTTGKGAAKIRWNTKGDWTRCVRHLGKYLGPRAAGYCALRHKEVTGLWTGDKQHRQMYGRKGNGRNVFSTELVNSTAQIVSSALLTARMEDAKSRVAMTASVGVDGASFVIPLVIPEDRESGDGRKFRQGSIAIRELPLPLMWQIKTGDGHQGSVVVGRIDHMERIEDGIGNAYGVFDTGAYGREAERLVRNGFIRGVSADMDQFEAEEEKPDSADEAGESPEETIGKGKLIINKARVMGATIVAKPAFQECKILLNEEDGIIQEDTMMPDGIYVDDVDPLDADSLVACAFVAGAIPVAPPADWFANPKLNKATPLTVTDDGRVFGHIAAWHVDHIGMAYGTKPPRSKSNYAYFHTGVVRTADGTDVPVGQLTLAGGHASLEASAFEAVKHYDDTASAIADVHAGEDAHGIWVSGSLRPSAQPEQIRALRASAPSGDWRPIRGNLELVAVCQVNVPGFPIARARVASGAVMALVAAGAQVLAKMKSDPITELSARINKLESLNSPDYSAQLLELRSRFAVAKNERNAALATKAAELSARVRGSEFNSEDYGDFVVLKQETRQQLAKEGKALPDGSFPIRNEDDLQNAVQSYGRASESKRAEVRRHIMHRARQLDRADLIPDAWKPKSSASITASLEAMRAKIEALSAAATLPTEDQVVDPKKAEAPADKSGADSVDTPVASEPAPVVDAQGVESTPVVDQVDPTTGEPTDPKYNPQTQPRDESGKFRKILARLKQDLGTAGLQKVAEDAKNIEHLHEVGNYADAAKAATQLIDTVDRLDSGALNKVSLENVRVSASELGKVIANLPLGFDNQAQKVRYSDLPPALQTLMENMMDRVEKKIGKKDAAVANAKLNAFKSGSDVYSQSEISSQMSKLLRLLT